MIDIHTHVLPFVDDGAKDIDASLRMIEESAAIGVKDLFCTPHYMKSRNYLSTAKANRQIYDNLLQVIEKQDIPIKLHLGNEIFYTIDSLQDLRDGTVMPLGNSRLVLIEFSLSKDHEDLDEAVHNVTSLGYVPVIAHPERYDYLDLKHDYPILRKMGAMFQVNASSIIGKSGHDLQKRALYLIKKGYADFVASDIHASRQNYMLEAFDFIIHKFGDAIARKLFENNAVFEKAQ